MLRAGSENQKDSVRSRLWITGARPMQHRVREIQPLRLTARLPGEERHGDSEEAARERGECPHGQSEAHFGDQGHEQIRLRWPWRKWDPAMLRPGNGCPVDFPFPDDWWPVS
jgi:hypothetical protein